MTTFYLARHGLNDWIGRALAGRREGVHLNEAGRAQAEDLARRLRDVQFAAIYSSPLERARETAEPVAAQAGLPIQFRERVIEVGFGDWTDRTFDVLNGDPVWQRFNSFRSSTRPPGGELMSDVVSRVVDDFEELRSLHAGENVLMVSHADVIKAAVGHYAGVPIDLMQRIEIAPASVSILRLAEWGPQLLAVNDTGSLGR